MDTTFDTFRADVIEASNKNPVLVDFWAPWCGPCRVLSPVLEKLEKESGGRWKVVKVNTDEEPELAQEFQIRSIPSVKLVHEGKLIGEFMGALPESEVRKWLEKNLPTEGKKGLEEAKAYLESGRTSNARKLLEQILKKDPQNVEVRILLAQTLIPAEIDKAEELVRNIEESAPNYDKVSSIKSLHRLVHMTNQTGEPAEDWNLYRRGIIAFRKGNFAEALESWIELVGRNRQLDDDGARKACVALFNLLGHDHELTQKYHRRFTSALY